MNHDDDPELTERQLLLADVLVGIRGLDDPAIATARLDPGFARLLASLLDLQQRLQRGVAAERAALAEPALPRDTKLSKLVQRQLRARWSSWTLGIVLCAAAVAVTGLVVATRWTPEAPSYQRLGESSVSCAPDYASIEWKPVPGAKRYRVRVLTPADNGELIDVEQSPVLDASTTLWQPQRRQDYRAWIRVEVTEPNIEAPRVLYRAEFLRSGQRR